MRRNQSQIVMPKAGIKKKYITFFSIVILAGLCAVKTYAQEIDLATYQKQYQLHIRKTAAAVKIDGLLDDAAWQEADSIGNFWMKYPKDDVKAVTNPTVVRVSYDDNFLYLSAVAYDSFPLIGQSLKRDSRLMFNDGVGFALDPVNKKTNGFYFSITAFNVQADDLLSNNQGDLNFSWDNKWYSATKQYPDHYNVEVAIPFKTLRYDKDNTVWGLNVVRSVQKKNEFRTWTRIPVNFRAVDLGYLGAMVWDAPPPKPGSNIAVIPYITGSVSQNKEAANTNIKGTMNAGIDGKIAVSSKLNLDLTVNPDFSQVEVDEQQTNLTRFNLFFPERRFFFLENDDIFSATGTPPARPFYSRRIGLDDNGKTIPILFGARLTGNITDNLRVGVMSMQTGEKNDNPSQNYSAVTLIQRVLKRSSVKVYGLNHQSMASAEELKDEPLSKYGRNAGGEFSYSNEAGDINAWVGYHKSYKPGITNDNTFLNAGFGYFGRNLNAFIDYVGMGTNYYADMGFLERIENYDAEKDTVIRYGYHTIFSEVGYAFYPKKGNINQHGINTENFFALNPDGSFNERTNDISYEVNFKNTSSVSAGFNNNEAELLFPASFTDGDPLPKGRYHYNQYYAEYNSDNRKMFSYQFGLTTGKFYNGDFSEYTAGIIFRKQPWLSIEFNAQINRLSFPGTYGKEDLFLLAPRIEVNFSTNIFWTTFIQYNTQNNNFNINSRLQWRYKPMSDLFVVYTDNYFTDPFLKNKSRSLVFKMNYWLNM